MDRTTWLEARRKGIGGTDAAAIVGLSRWRSAIDVWEDKLGLAPERPATPAMSWGLALEDAIATAYTSETGRPTRRGGGIRRAHHVKDFPMIGSIDRLTYMTAEPVRVVELKTARSDDGFADRDGWRDVSPERRVPAGYYVQVQHYAEVVDVEIVDVAVLFGGSDFRIYEIPRDRDFGADLRAEEGAFWRDYVLTETQPPVGADDLAFLSRKYPASSDVELVATSELAVLVDEYLAAAANVELSEQRRDELRARIEDAMGSAAKLIAPSGFVSWKSHERTSTTWKAYAETLEAAIERARLEYPATRNGLDAVLSDGVGTTDLSDVRSLYSSSATVRPFSVRKAKEA